MKADSGNTSTREFCPKCGSPLFGKPSGLPMKLMGLRAVTLDDPSWYKPTMSIYTSSAQPWDFINPELPKFPKMPPM